MSTGFRAQAQDPYPVYGGTMPLSKGCFDAGVSTGIVAPPPTGTPTGTPIASAGPTPPPVTPNSTNGIAFTPKGNLKILIVFAGFTQDDDATCGTSTLWPFAVSGGAPTALPATLSSDIYTSPTQFSLGATDQTLSNFFYQMSRTAATPFKVTFGYIPTRINVSRTSRSYGDMAGFSADALAAAVAQYNTTTANFPWSEYDQHTNSPNFNTDNSATGPDGKLDYVIVCWRTGCQSGLPGSTGLGGVPGITIPATTQHPAYQIATGHCQAGSSFEIGTCLHEMAHTLYNAPHLFGANGTVGNHFYHTFGWGMMQNIPTNYSVSAWERWYLGWTSLKTGIDQVNSDIFNAASLTATNGLYTLRDYTTTGDVVRITLPNSRGQHVWLENRALNGPCDTRRGGLGTAGDGLPLPAPPAGLLAMVESMGSRTAMLSPYDKTKVNGLRAVSAQGNFDYYPSGALSNFNNHGNGNTTYNYVGNGTLTGNAPVPNPTGGHSEITNIRGDRDGDGIIRYDDYHGNNDVTVGNEKTLLYRLNGAFNDGPNGPNIGTRTVGFRYGLDSNPMLIPHQTYDNTTKRLSVIPLSGLSVELTAYDASTGDITVRVRYDNTNIKRDTRWTGELRTYPVANAIYGAEIFVTDNATLTLDRSATPQRDTPGPGNDFVNDTRLTIAGGTQLVAIKGQIILKGPGTTLYLEDNASMDIAGGGVVTANAGTTISVQYQADIAGYSNLVMKVGSQLIVRSTGQVIPGTLRPAPTAYPNPSTGAFTISWAPGEQQSNNAPVRYELQDLRGKTVQQGQVAEKGAELRGLAPSLYLLVTRDADGRRQTQRVEVR